MCSRLEVGSSVVTCQPSFPIDSRGGADTVCCDFCRCFARNRPDPPLQRVQGCSTHGYEECVTGGVFLPCCCCRVCCRCSAPVPTIDLGWPRRPCPFPLFPLSHGMFPTVNTSLTTWLSQCAVFCAFANIQRYGRCVPGVNYRRRSSFRVTANPDQCFQTMNSKDKSNPERVYDSLNY